jgi:uncharacterized repeat protein (TIGR03803 family)
MHTVLETTKRVLRGEPGKHAGLFAILSALGLASPIMVSSGHCAQLQIIKAFGNPDQTGKNPYSPLTEGRSDGVLYGTTYAGGLGNAGTVFAINKDGSNYRILHHFGVINADGVQLYGRVIECSDGALYGTTWRGGTHDTGTVFKLNKDGSGYAILHSFGPAPADGNNPPAGLIEGSNGFLYGTTQLGGTTGQGTTYVWSEGRWPTAGR